MGVDHTQEVVQSRYVCTAAVLGWLAVIQQCNRYHHNQTQIFLLASSLLFAPPPPTQPPPHTESRHLGRPGLTLPPGTCGREVSPNVISWSYKFSGWEVFVLETCEVLYCPGLGTGETMFVHTH